MLNSLDSLYTFGASYLYQKSVRLREDQFRQTEIKISFDFGPGSHRRAKTGLSRSSTIDCYDEVIPASFLIDCVNQLVL